MWFPAFRGAKQIVFNVESQGDFVAIAGLNISSFSVSTLTKPPKTTPSYSPVTLISIGILACKCTCSNPDNSRKVLACSNCQMAELNFGLAKSVEKTVMTLHVPWKKVGMVTFVCY